MFVTDKEKPKAEPFVAIYSVKDVVMYTCAKNFRYFVFNLMIRYIKQQRKLKEEINPEIINALTSFTGHKLDDIEIDSNYDKLLKKYPETEQVFFPHLIPAEKIDSDIYAHNGNRETIIVDKKTNSLIKIDEIRYIEAGNKSFSVHFKKKTETYNKSLSFVENQLPQDKFYRCHKSYIAGFKHIAKITEDEVIFDNGKKAAVSRRKLAEFNQKFDEYKSSRH
jgi:DNA-binding LytR/AlgR family response regulator